MRRIFLLSLIILFQSCFSYKTFTSGDYDQLIDKKVKIITNQNEVLKGRLKNVENDKLIIEKNKKITNIPTNDISEIKKKKFSILKTLGLDLLAGTIGLFLLYYIFFGSPF